MFDLVYLALVFYKLFFACIKSTFSYHKVSRKERKTTVTLSWNKKKLQFNFKEFQNGFDEATVKDLKEKCKLVTDVPIASMNLQVSGANIKDDSATLTSVGVRTNSVITLNGEAVNHDVVKQTASGNPEEYGLMLRISKIVDSISKELIQQIDDFEKTVESSQPPLSDADKKKLQDKGIYLSEVIMQSLIKLDCVECPSEFETARQRRREGVRLSQQLLERVDKSRTILRELCKK